MKSLREIYFTQLGIDPDPASPVDRRKRKAALARAYELRSFEIEHYWKRATHFWGYQAAMFIAFGALLSTRTGGFFPLAIPIAALGFFTAIANVAASQGSKFWQENWEKHIDMLEDEFEGRLHKTVWLGKSCCHPSVSRVNGLLGWVLLLFWPLAAVGTAWLWNLGAGTQDQNAVESIVGNLSSPIPWVAGLLCLAFLGVIGWHLSLSSPRGNTILRNGDVGTGCDQSSQLGPLEPLLVSRHNPADEPTSSGAL